MHSGGELLETWIPDGGFKIERRRVKAPDGGSTITECLVPNASSSRLDWLRRNDLQQDELNGICQISKGVIHWISRQASGELLKKILLVHQRAPKNNHDRS
jgi:hypothetical protein